MRAGPTLNAIEVVEQRQEIKNPGIFSIINVQHFLVQVKCIY